MKKLKKFFIIILFVFITIILLNQKVLANEPSFEIKRAEYSEEFNKWLELSDKEKENTIQPRIYDILNTNNTSKNPFYKMKTVQASMIPTYNLKNIIPNNLVIRNQMQTNSCWAFATLSSLETNLAMANLRNETNTSKVYDYSERHLEYATSRVFKNNAENKMGYNRKVGEGGNWFFAQSYLTNGSGAIDEASMKFENNENEIEINQIQNKTVTSQVYDTVDFPDYMKESGENRTKIMNQIKQHIQNYGAVYSNIHGNTSSSIGLTCYENSTGAKYCSNSSLHPIDHAISIVGWDDNYSVEKFSSDSRPQNNGAWIVRNSWGEREEYSLSELKEELFEILKTSGKPMQWSQASDIPDDIIKEAGFTIEGEKAYLNIGDNGFIYVSYEDCNISQTISGIVKATDTVNYENIYQYDVYYPAYTIELSEPKMFLANVFDKKTSGTEFLTQISLCVPETYTCKVYVNPNGESKLKKDLQLVNLKNGESENVNAGYHTLEFAKAVEIKSNKFVVAVEIQGTRTNALDIYMESKVDILPDFNYVEVEKNKCFITDETDLNNGIWQDLSSLSSINKTLLDGDSTIKAFTVSNVFDDSLKSIEIVSPPKKTSYFEGENFNKEGMQIRANYNSKTKPSVILDDTSYSITDGTNLKAGQTSVTITYEDKSVQQKISVEKNDVVELKITNPPTKTAYKEGEHFNKDGMVVEATYKNGTKKTITDYTIENRYNVKSNQTYVTISYGGKTVKQNITVTPNPLQEIKVTKAPNKTKYTVGENFDKTGMVISGTFQDGMVEEIIEYTIENGTNLKNGQNSVTIKYEGKTTTQAITVEEKAINSNFDNAKLNVNKVQAYYFTDDAQKDYTLVNVEIDNISRNMNNDSFEYYYYLSSNANEQNIDKWIKISETQKDDNKLEFTIDSRKISNYEQLANEDVIYLYIKEVAIKGKNQSVKISKSMKLETDKKIETYVDNKIKDNFQSNNDNNNGNFAAGKFPYTGIGITIILSVVIITGIGIFVYVRYKNLSKYIK